MADSMRVQILEDGTVKVTTGKIGAQNHMSADAMLAYLAKLLGGKTTIESRGDHAHVHTHGEDHVHN